MAQIKKQYADRVLDLNDQISELKNEVVDLNDQISRLKTSHESELAQYRSEISKLQEEINKSEAYSRPALLDMDEQATEEALKNFDAIILAAIERRPLGLFFRLNELFGQCHWSTIADDTRGEMEEQFRSQVERGDFVGASTLAKANGPQRYMKA